MTDAEFINTALVFTLFGAVLTVGIGTMVMHFWPQFFGHEKERK